MDDEKDKLNEEPIDPDREITSERETAPRFNISIKRVKRKSRPVIILLDVLIVLLVLAGIYFLLEPEYLHCQQDRMTQDLMNAYDGGEATILIDPNAYAVPGEEPVIDETYGTVSTDTETTTLAPTPTPLPDTVVVTALGRIRIPVIKVNMPISEGANKYNLRLAIGHYTNSASAGQSGLAIYLGHRMYTYGRHFNRLGEVKIGDQIIIENKSFRYTYEVDQIDTVLPIDLAVEFSAQYQESRIMLVTCTPVKIATHRLLVKAKLIGTENLS